MEVLKQVSGCIVNSHIPDLRFGEAPGPDVEVLQQVTHLALPILYAFSWHEACLTC